MSEFAADGQSQARAPELAAGPRIRLLKRLEDDPLLVERNADSGIRHFEGNHRHRLPQNRMIFTPTAGGSRNRENDASLFGELESVGQQVLEHLMQTL